MTNLKLKSNVEESIVFRKSHFGNILACDMQLLFKFQWQPCARRREQSAQSAQQTALQAHSTSNKQPSTHRGTRTATNNRTDNHTHTKLNFATCGRQNFDYALRSYERLKTTLVTRSGGFHILITYCHGIVMARPAEYRRRRRLPHVQRALVWTSSRRKAIPLWVMSLRTSHV